MLRRFASRGRVLGLNQLMGRDGTTLADATAETRQVVSFEGEVVGLPCINVSNLLLYRRDLLDRYSLPVPQSWDEVKSVGTKIQKAVRRDSAAEFYAFASRGAGGGGHSVWSMRGPCWVPMGASGRPETSCWSRWASRSARPLPRTSTC